MSNPLSVRRVKVVTVEESGEENENETSYGIVASDNMTTAFKDTFETRDELEVAIQAAPSILAVVDPLGEKFPDADHSKIGRDNFYGKGWTITA